MGVLGGMRDRSENQSWLAAVFFLGSSSPPVNATTAPTLALSSGAGLPSDALQVKVSPTAVPDRVNGAFVPVGKIYNVGPEDPMSQYPYSLRLPAGKYVELDYSYDAAVLKDAGLTREFAVQYLDTNRSEWGMADKIQIDLDKQSVSAFSGHMTPFVITAVAASNGNLAPAPSCITSDYPGGIGGSAGAQLTTIDAGFRYLKDRNYYIVQDSNFQDLGFSQALGVATCNGDSSCGTFEQHKLNQGQDYVNFTAHTNIDVYLMYDSRGGTNLADASADAPWIAAAGFVNTGRYIRTTDAAGRFRVYKKSYAKGQQVHLDGNRSGVSSKGIQSNYWLVLKRQGDTGASAPGSICEAAGRPAGSVIVSNVTAVPGADRVLLTWQNPDDPKFAGVIIRRSTLAPPSLVTDGVAVSGTSVNPQAFIDETAAANTNYYYTLFAYDQSSNVQTGVSVAATTGPDTDVDGISDAYEGFATYGAGGMTNVNQADTDGDGVGDALEIANGTDPTNADTTAPIIDTFVMTSQTPTNDPVVRFTLAGSDNTAITGWMVTRTPNKPRAAAGGWQSAAPTYFTLTSAGNYTLYAWAKDAAGNVAAAGVTLAVQLDAINVPRWVYVSHGTDPNGYIGIYGIQAGMLSPVQNIASGRLPEELAIDQDHNTLYAVDTNSSTVIAFRIDPNTGLLTKIQTIDAMPGYVSYYLTLNPLRGLLHVEYAQSASPYAGGVATFTIDPVTRMIAPASTIAVDSLPSRIGVSGNGNFFLVGKPYGDNVSVIKVNPDNTATGVAVVSAGSFTQGAFFHPNGIYAYSPNYSGCSVSGYHVDPSNGATTALGTTPACCGGGYIDFSPDGKFLYVSCSTDHVLNVFEVSLTGALTSRGTVSAGTYPYSVGVTNDYVYSTDTQGTDLHAFLRDPLTGALSLMQTVFASATGTRYLTIYSQHDGNDP
ncbi:MAG: beta-propeller fold lactonase family protein, partial [Spirochaetia bacterium]|nr:beta-propeller fold lactonase family protein [Spirochaetia bacterium]